MLSLIEKYECPVQCIYTYSMVSQAKDAQRFRCFGLPHYHSFYVPVTTSGVDDTECY